MRNSHVSRTTSIVVFLVAVIAGGCSEAPTQKSGLGTDPLPSWAEGPVKSAIIEFVQAVTTQGGPKYVSVGQRIATFDQDGTLWCEQPVAQLEFVIYRIKQLAVEHPEWHEQQPFKAVLEGDSSFLVDDMTNNHGKKVMELMMATHAGMPIDEFDRHVEEFLDTSRHPKYNKKYTEIVYQPMLELLIHLRANGFSTYICSGGGKAFMRVFTEETYGVVPENVIGSFAMNSFEQIDGSWKIVKSAENLFVNDGLTKPAGIEQQIGRIPIFCGGNVRTGGDIGQLTYSHTNKLPNFQMLINHDDDIRESAYSEDDNASLRAAQEQGWHVVSMKNDWKQIFPFE